MGACGASKQGAPRERRLERRARRHDTYVCGTGKASTRESHLHPVEERSRSLPLPLLPLPLPLCCCCLVQAYLECLAASLKLDLGGRQQALAAVESHHLLRRAVDACGQRGEHKTGLNEMPCPIVQGPQLRQLR